MIHCNMIPKLGEPNQVAHILKKKIVTAWIDRNWTLDAVILEMSGSQVQQ